MQRALAKVLRTFCRQGAHIEARNHGNTNPTSATPEATLPEKTKPDNVFTREFTHFGILTMPNYT